MEAYSTGLNKVPVLSRQAKQGEQRALLCGFILRLGWSNVEHNGSAVNCITFAN